MLARPASARRRLLSSLAEGVSRIGGRRRRCRRTRRAYMVAAVGLAIDADTVSPRRQIKWGRKTCRLHGTTLGSLNSHPHVVVLLPAFGDGQDSPRILPLG